MRKTRLWNTRRDCIRRTQGSKRGVKRNQTQRPTGVTRMKAFKIRKTLKISFTGKNKCTDRNGKKDCIDGWEKDTCGF